MTVLNNVEIEYKEAEIYIKDNSPIKINHLISKFLRDVAIKEKKQPNKKSRWAKLADKMHEKSPLDGVSEEANKLFKQFREESSF